MRFLVGFVLGLALGLSGSADAATCAATNVDGFLYLTTESLAECSGHVLMDASEYSQVPTLQALFAWPESSDLGQIWLAGFTLPMICYLAAWGYGVVVNFFKPENDEV